MSVRPFLLPVLAALASLSACRFGADEPVPSGREEKAAVATKGRVRVSPRSPAKVARTEAATEDQTSPPVAEGAAPAAEGSRAPAEARPPEPREETAPPETRPGGVSVSRSKREEPPKAEGAPEAEEPPKAEEPPAAGKDSSDSALSADCRATLSSLRQLRSAIPLVFIDFDRPVNALDGDIKKAIELGESFLENCGEPPVASWVKVYLGRDYLSRYRRYAEEYRQVAQSEAEQGGLSAEDARLEVRDRLADEMGRYRNRIRQLADDALQGSSPEDETRYHALALLADLSGREADFNAQIDYTRKILEQYPDAKHRPKFLSDVGKALLFQSKYEGAVDWLKEVAEKHKDDEEYVVYNSDLFEALTGIGDLEGMEDLMRRIREEYPKRLERVQSKHYRNQYEQWYDLSTFWIGFVRYALGDIEGAKEALRKGIRHLEVKKRELEGQGRGLPNVQQIYLNFRYLVVLSFLEEQQGREPGVEEFCAGKVAALDLTEGIRWATDSKLPLKEAMGKVVAMLFRLPGNRRSETFLLELDELDRRMDELEALTLGFFPTSIGEEQAEQRLARMRAELERLEVEMPAGFDSSPSQCIFRSMRATVGTPSFIVLDRQGRYAWYLPDPRDLDRKIMVRVLERLTGSS